LKAVKKIFDSLPKIITDSLVVAFAFLGGIDIVLSVADISLEKIGGIPARISVVLLAYIILLVVTIFMKYTSSKNEIILDIRGIKIVIKEGDLFNADGWKLVPFNEHFDTQVDDVVIAHSSLNGKFIDSLTNEEKVALIQAIASDNNSPLQHINKNNWEKTKFELGTIKVYKDFMMLALTHFNEQNVAHILRAEYEHALRNMWKEIRRTHQGKIINIPLIGGGLTQLDDMTEKPNEHLLKCIICTLSTSNVTFDDNVQINIVLTKKALETINLYDLKGWL
jgi:hypothetical protein